MSEMMFGAVWSWAGKYRTTKKSIGIDPTQISEAVRALTRDCSWWLESDPATVAAARFHHRLVAIHPFPNGNGRHARAATDYLAGALTIDRPSWGAKSGVEPGELRRRYVDALRTADRDRDDLDALVAFMRS